MAKSSGGSDVLVKIGGDTSEFQSTLGGLLGDLQGMVAGLNPVLAGVAAAVVGIGVAAVDVAEQYETATNTIRIGTGATGEALETLKADFNAVFLAVPEDAGTVATAIADLNTRLGLTGQPLQDLTNQFLDLAGVVGIDVADAVRLGTRVLGDWGEKAGEPSKAMDTLFIASQQTGIGFDSLADQMVQFGAPMRALGFTFTETAALMGQWEQQGVNSGLVLGGLKIALNNFAEAGIPAREGLEAVIEKISAIKEPSEAAAAAAEFFGKKAGTDMADLIQGGRLEVDALVASIGASTETISAADSSTETFNEKLTVFLHNVQSLLEPLGTGLVEGGRMALDAINGLFSGTGDLSEGLSALLGWLAPLTDALATYAAPAIGAVLTAFIGLESFIGSALIATLQFLWNNVLAPLATFLRDVLVGAVQLVFGALNSFIGVLEKIPGVSKLFEEGQRAVNLVLGDAKTKANEAKTATDSLKTAHSDIKTPVKDNEAGHKNLNLQLKDTKAKADDAKRAAHELKQQHDISKTAVKNHEKAVNENNAQLKKHKEELKNIKAELPPLDQVYKDIVVTLGPGPGGLAGSLAALPPYLNTLEQQTNTTKAALKALGVDPKEDLVTLAETAKANFGIVQSSGTASATEIDRAQMAMLKAVKDAYIQSGKDIPPELQSTLTALEGKYSTHKENVAGPNGFFAQMKTNINQSITSLSTDLVKSLFDDPGSFGKKALDGLKTIGESVVTSFITPATTAISGFISGTLADLLGGKGFGGIKQHLDDLSGAFGGIFGGGASTATTAAGGAVTAAGGGTSAAGGAASGAASGAAGWVTAIGSAVSAITDVLGMFGVGVQGTMKETLNAIHNDTTFLAQEFGDRGLSHSLMGGMNDLKAFVSGWGSVYIPAFASLMWTQEQALTSINDTRELISKIDFRPEIKVTVTNYLDSDEITSRVEEKIEFNSRLATA